MSNTKLSSLTIAAAVVGAVSMAAAVAAPTGAIAEDKVKCYGVAKAGENGCGSASGSHGCSGQAKVDYSYDEWKLAMESECLEMGGSLEAKEGINEELADKG